MCGFSTSFGQNSLLSETDPDYGLNDSFGQSSVVCENYRKNGLNNSFRTVPYYKRMNLEYRMIDPFRTVNFYCWQLWQGCEKFIGKTVTTNCLYFIILLVSLAEAYSKPYQIGNQYYGCVKSYYRCLKKN